MSNNIEEEKQNYLRENILDKGYEAEDFVSFLVTKKGDDGVDLSNWSFDELRMVVQEYLYSHPKTNINNVQMPQQIQPNYQQKINSYQMPTNQIPVQNQMMMPNNQNINNINSINNMNNNIITGMNNNNMINNNMINDNIINNINTNDNQMNNNNNMNYTGYNQENNEIYIPQDGTPTDEYGITNLQVFSCQVLEQSEMAKYENVQIEMSLGEKVTGTFFTKSYMTFIITTSPLNFNVKRRYSDFDWLRQALQANYSSSLIPPIPKKTKIRIDRFDELFLLKRKRYLEKFLNSLLRDPVIRVSQILYDFLSIEEESLFISKKKMYSSAKLPSSLNEIKSLDGKIDITINDERETSYYNIKEIADVTHDLLNKFNKNMKQLNSEMVSVFNRMDEITKICDELLLNSFRHYEVDSIKISFYELKNMFKYWSMALKKQSCIINVNMREYFKYIKNSFRSLKELINISDVHKNNYYKHRKSLIAKKEDLFKKNDVNKWDLGPNKGMSIVSLLKDKAIAFPKMLYTETNNVINMKQMYGYYLNRVICEFLRLRKSNEFGYQQNVLDNTKIGITILSELFKNISDIATGGEQYKIKNIEKEFEQYVFTKTEENSN